MSDDQLTLPELHALPDNALLNATQAARLLQVSSASFSRLLQDGALEECRIELRRGMPRYAKGIMLASLGALAGTRRIAGIAANVTPKAWPKSAQG